MRRDDKPRVYGWAAADAAVRDGTVRVGDLRRPHNSTDTFAAWDGEWWDPVMLAPEHPAMARRPRPTLPDRAVHVSTARGTLLRLAGAGSIGLGVGAVSDGWSTVVGIVALVAAANLYEAGWRADG